MNQRNQSGQRNSLVSLLLLLSLIIGFGCSKHIPSITKESEIGGEKLLWSSQPDRPDWIYKEPALKDGYLAFVGLSGDYATEKLSRDDAMRNFRLRIVEYLGTMAKSKFEEVSTSFGLASNVIDPTDATRSYQKFLSANITREVKENEVYVEKWNTPTGIAYRSFILTKVRRSVIEDLMKNFAKDNIEKAKEAARNAADEMARDQAQKAKEFWEEMESGTLMKEE